MSMIVTYVYVVYTIAVFRSVISTYVDRQPGAANTHRAAEYITRHDDDDDENNNNITRYMCLFN